MRHGPRNKRHRLEGPPRKSSARGEALARQIMSYWRVLSTLAREGSQEPNGSAAWKQIPSKKNRRAAGKRAEKRFATTARKKKLKAPRRHPHARNAAPLSQVHGHVSSPSAAASVRTDVFPRTVMSCQLSPLALARMPSLQCRCFVTICMRQGAVPVLPTTRVPQLRSHKAWRSAWHRRSDTPQMSIVEIGVGIRNKALS